MNFGFKTCYKLVHGESREELHCAVFCVRVNHAQQQFVSSIEVDGPARSLEGILIIDCAFFLLKILATSWTWSHYVGSPGPHVDVSKLFKVPLRLLYKWWYRLSEHLAPEKKYSSSQVTSCSLLKQVACYSRHYNRVPYGRSDRPWSVLNA